MIRAASALALAFLFILTACDGPTGPRGPAGPGGAQVSSFTIEYDLDQIQRSDFVANERYDFPEIDANVIRDGAVLGYYRDLVGTWSALPYTFSVEAADDPPRVDYTFDLNYAFGAGTIDVFVEASSSDPVVWDEIRATELFSAPLDIKIVIIQDYVAGKTGPDLSDYEAVAAYYGLE